MFLVGGALSVWEGVTALLHPRPLEEFEVGVGVLVVAFVLHKVTGSPSPTRSRRSRSG